MTLEYPWFISFSYANYNHVILIFPKTPNILKSPQCSLPWIDGWEMQGQPIPLAVMHGASSCQLWSCWVPSCCHTLDQFAESLSSRPLGPTPGQLPSSEAPTVADTSQPLLQEAVPPKSSIQSESTRKECCLILCKPHFNPTAGVGFVHPFFLEELGRKGKGWDRWTDLG